MSKLRIVMIGLMGLLMASCNSQQQSTPAKVSTDSVTAAQPRDSVVITLAAVDSTTVFDLLTASHAVDYQSSAIGIFVKGIDSVYGTADAFWVYSVNDSMPEIAADKYVVHAGDTVRWHLRLSRQ